MFCLSHPATCFDIADGVSTLPSCRGASITPEHVSRTCLPSTYFSLDASTRQQITDFCICVSRCFRVLASFFSAPDLVLMDAPSHTSPASGPSRRLRLRHLLLHRQRCRPAGATVQQPAKRYGRPHLLNTKSDVLNFHIIASIS